jgi:chromosome segregation ATPase
MKQDSELGRLENFVAKLLDRFNALQADKAKVDELLLEREETIATLEDELASLKDERGEISSRVSGLLGRIEEWEAGVKESGDSDGGERGNPEGGVVQGSLF